MLSAVLGFVINHPIISFVLFVLFCLFLIGMANYEEEEGEGDSEGGLIWIEKTDFKTNHMKIIDEDVQEGVETKMVWKVGSDNSCGTIHLEINGETISTHTLYNIDASYFKYKVLFFVEGGKVNWKESIHEKTL